MTSPPNKLQATLALIVALTWVGVTFIPYFSTGKGDERLALGVQTAMMLVLGAIFGKNIFRGRNGTNNDS